MWTRREFVGTVVGGAAVLAGSGGRSEVNTASGRRWRKAFMLGQVEGDLRPAFEALREAGFEGVELISPNRLERGSVLRARDETGLEIHGVSGALHWAKPLSDPDPAVVTQGVEAILQEVEDCRAYGGTTVLVVPGVVTPRVSHRQVEERSRRVIRESLVDQAAAAGVILAIEEVWNRFLLSAPEFAAYIDSFESPWVRAYFDVGNVVEYGYPQEWIRELGPRIVKVHVKEYGKAKRFDYRLGEGEVDWKEVRQALRDVGYEGWITAEVPARTLEEYRDLARRMDELLGW
ncbi:MAG: xylose isomerase [Isosphaeraceae bacterium]|nr:MAG: xylose isomerase [Isosphaeraceae bacterium]